MTIDDIRDDVRVQKIITDFKKVLDAEAAAERKRIDAILIVRRRYSGFLNRRTSHPPLKGATIA